MNLELFIARKVLYSKETKDNLSRPIAKIAVFSIALSITIIICTIFIVTGFKREVSSKITGFGGHIQISKLSSNISYETPPISPDQDFYPFIDTIKGIKNIQIYATIPGIIKTNDIIQAVVLKGIGSDFNWSFFQQHLVEGEIFMVSDSVKDNSAIISRRLADVLKLQVGDKFDVYFIQDPIRMRRFKIKGLYETPLVEFDEKYILIDIKHVQKIKWDSNLVSGFEINIDDFSQLERMTNEVADIAGFRVLDDGSVLQVTNIKEKNIQLFDWLGLFDMNVFIIIFIMLIVAGINMISGLLILVLEKTQMIGVLKAFGTENTSVKKIFLYISGFITLKGLFWGNLTGFIICFLQYKYQFLKLDPSAYMLNAVPVNFNIIYWLLINIAAFAAILLVLLIPSSIIARISPAETIRYE